MNPSRFYEGNIFILPKYKLNLHFLFCFRWVLFHSKLIYSHVYRSTWVFYPSNQSQNWRFINVKTKKNVTVHLRKYLPLAKIKSRNFQYSYFCLFGQKIGFWNFFENWKLLFPESTYFELQILTHHSLGFIRQFLAYSCPQSVCWTFSRFKRNLGTQFWFFVDQSIYFRALEHIALFIHDKPVKAEISLQCFETAVSILFDSSIEKWTNTI